MALAEATVAQRARGERSCRVHLRCSCSVKTSARGAATVVILAATVVILAVILAVMLAVAMVLVAVETVAVMPQGSPRRRHGLTSWSRIMRWIRRACAH